MRVTMLLLFCGTVITAQNPQSQTKSGYPLPIQGRSVIATKYGIFAASQPMAAVWR